jgi:hypothetical protein
MSKVITATAEIRASDKTGAVFDKIASKFKSLVRQCVSETMLATAVGFVLRSVGDDLLRS